MTDLPDSEYPRAPVDAQRSAPAGASDSDPSRPRSTNALAAHPNRQQRPFRVSNPRIFAGFPLVFLLFLLWLGATQSGLRTLLDLVTELNPDRFQVGLVEGRLFGRLVVADLSIQLPAFSIRIGRIDLAWSPLRAFGGTLSIAEIRATDVDLVPSDRVRDSEDPVVLPDLLLPLSIELVSARVERLRIFTADSDGAVAVVERAELSGRLADGLLSIDRVGVVMVEPAFESHGSGTARLTGAYPLDLDMNWELRPTRSAHLLGHTRLGGDLTDLAVLSTVTGSVDLDLDVVFNDPLGHPRWSGALALVALDLPAFDAALREVAFSGTLAIGGDTVSTRVTGEIQAEPAERPALGRLAASLDLLWKNSAVEIRSLDLRRIGSRMQLSARGLIDLNSTAGLDSAPAQSHATGPDSSVSAPAWDLHLSGTALNPAELLAAFIVDADPERWSGLLDLQVASHGRLTETGLALTAALEGLSGELRGYPVSATGDFALAEGRLVIDGFRAESGPSMLRIDGALDTSLDLRFALDSPDLASLYPGASGRVQASGAVSGGVGSPRLQVELNAGDVGIAEHGILRLSALADLDLAPDGRLEIRVDGQDLLIEGRRWKHLSIRGEGRRADHRLDLSLAGDPFSVALSLAGGLEETGSYRGQMTALRLDSPDGETWDLGQPSPVAVTWPSFSAGPLCIRHARGSGGCFEISRDADAAVTLGVTLDRLDLEFLAPLLPKDLSLEGDAALDGRFVARGADLEGRATASLSTGLLRLPNTRGPGEVIRLSGARLDIDAGAGNLRSRLALPLEGLGQADVDLELTGWRLDDPVRPAQPLSGRIRARLDGLERFGDPIPQLSRLRGHLGADIALGGTLGKPGMRGEARIERAGFNVPLLGLDVADLTLSARAASADRIRISGGADVGDGRLEIGGDGGFGPDGARVRLRATGERLVLIDTSEYFVRVSPRLDLDATAQGAQVRGEIVIPEARISPRALPAGTLRPSNDVVIKGTDRPPRYPIDLAIGLRVLDGVSLNAFGLTGSLAGNLDLIQPPGRDLSGDGQLQIRDGQYRIPTGLGIAADLVAPLTISRGQLIWVRNPIRNPGLLFLAQRGSGRTTANVRVIGTLADPQFTFFSNTDPAMSQSDAITFLATGIAPGGTAADHSAAFAFGRYIAPGIFLEYETGLGDARNRFRLRRNLTDRIQLEAQSGASQSVDLFWSFEPARSDRPTLDPAPGGAIDRD
ncbi:MAG: translocation/assembly module TamB domain-containing protein [Thiocapsa sp.]|uniref:translocation/assembly module TamB domain-containing protein n=1 Tax=Thiocapsa sp. TaxID=2024551 RepID=UPI001BD0E692|nr:translocation/assembly module TamB domain-containing protein [Thiocapsa sp.]QVL47574.1 MAG: translocation/assembly module TamB domain-containing protein [Thiocapsa sp.]